MKRIYLLILVMLVAFMPVLTSAQTTEVPTATPEVIYLLDTISAENVGGDGSTLFRVALDSSATPPEAILTKLYHIDDPNFDYPGALACTPDGKKVYIIDTTTSQIAYYDVSTDGFVDTGNTVRVGANTVTRIVQAAFSPLGVLYVASAGSTDKLYTVDPDNGNAISKGKINVGSSTIDIDGADLVFDADGNLYLFTNYNNKLYLVDTTVIPLTATQVKSIPDFYFTGLAIRGNGTGKFLGSVRALEGVARIFEFDLPGSPIPYVMYLDDVQYPYQFGDMSIGPFRVCTKTIGYWKTHSWNGASVTICGETITEEKGKEILWAARGNSWSMFFAQLIAAKLNVPNGYFPEEESWLCTNGPVVLLYSQAFEKKDPLKSTASQYWDGLAAFNETFECNPAD